jgi:hypothetical protein
MTKKKEIEFDEDFPDNQCPFDGRFLTFEEQEDGCCDSCYKKLMRIEPE